MAEKRKRRRIDEPSTHAGIAAAMASLLPVLPPGLQAGVSVLGAIFGAIAIYKREAGGS